MVAMSARQFKLTAPVPLERDIHEQCAKVLDAVILPPAMWTPYPAGVVQLSPAQQAAFSRFGLKRGMPDLWFMHEHLYMIELKRRGGSLTKTRITYTKRGAPRELLGQDRVFPALLRTGAVKEIAVCFTIDEVLKQLDRWEIPRRRTY
jgi:hypothetical protein